MSTYVVDTHALVWYLTSDPRLSLAARQLLIAPDSMLLIPTLVLAEIKHLSAKGRLPVAFKEVIADLIADPRCEICAIELSTVFATPTTLDIHDSMIVGVALAHTGVVDGIITKDAMITQSGLVKTFW